MNRPIAISVAALAAAALLLESTLLRMLAVTQFYHFAFLVVSLALLGFGASGTLLSISSRIRTTVPLILLAFCGIGFAISTILAYGTVNLLPFDSYSIAWDRRQILYFALYYLILTLPFVCAGLGIAMALTIEGKQSHIIYSANLLGSAVGVLLAPLAFWLSGVPGAVILSCLIGLLPILYQSRFIRLSASIAMLAGLIAICLLSVSNLGGHAVLGMAISPYKGLSYAHQYPDSVTRFSQWNAFSYVELVSNAGTRVLPGLSYMVPDVPTPEQNGISIDADSLLPVTLVKPDQFDAAGYLPEAVAFRLRPETNALVLEAGTGLGILQALAGGARQVTATIDNPLILQAIHHSHAGEDFLFDPRVQVISEMSRVFLRRDHHYYDVIFLPLTDAYRPITSGAYSLGEDYTLTVEACRDILARLSPGGILVITRWLQTPPSESIRLIAMLDEAYNKSNAKNTHGYANLSNTLVAYRGIQTFTVIIQPDGWNSSELTQLRTFMEEKHYDLVWAPDIQPEETNRFNLLPQPVDYELISAMFSTSNRTDFYETYPYAITPPTDDRPFFFHFFRWGQMPEVLANLGRKWQPFGGSGYLVLFALLILVIFLSSGLIVIPLLFYRIVSKSKKGGKVPAFAYFTLLGVAYLFVEIPLIQRSILLLGRPTYAFTAVVLSLLLFSSLGSLLARKTWLPRRIAMPILVILAVLTPFICIKLGEAALGWSLPARSLAIILSLAPLAVLMGLPFPFGLAWLEQHYPALTPWAWAVNGCASVIASVLAAILALSYGFTVVLYLGAAAYGGAAGLQAWMQRPSRGLAC
jgi:spermidine synthase